MRGDGRHQLVTLFESVSLADELRLTTLEAEDGSDQVHLPRRPGPEPRLARAAGLRDRGWDGPPVRVEITKRIPVAAGMGGGSADAAAALRLAQRLGGADEDWIAELAAELGADVPAQLAPGLALGTGAGELVRAAGPDRAARAGDRPAPGSAVHPGGVPRGRSARTAAHRGRTWRLAAPRSTAALATGSVLPAELMVNELEPAARSLCPRIDEGDARAAAPPGPQGVFVCGSGPTCAGLWWGEDALVLAASAATALACRFPGATAVVPVTAEAGRVVRR